MIFKSGIVITDGNESATAKMSNGILTVILPSVATPIISITHIVTDPIGNRSNVLARNLFVP